MNLDVDLIFYGTTTASFSIDEEDEPSEEGGTGLRRCMVCYDDAQRYDGKWVLETNDDTISLEDAAFGYKGLLVIERCFRSLKRIQIKMTPMFHWLPHRIEAHVHICVLALLTERVAELACAQSWFRIRRVGTRQIL